MDVWRVAALPVVGLAFAFAACSSPEPEATPMPIPSAPAPTPSDGLAVVSTTSSPVLVDRSCADFSSQTDAQAFYIEAGGPDQDLHGLDPDHNGNACDEQTASPAAFGASPAPTTSTASVSVATTPQPPAGPPQEVHSSSGAVEGKTGGSNEQSSCESSDPSRCD